MTEQQRGERVGGDVGSGSHLDYEGRRPVPAGDPVPGNSIAAALCVVGAGIMGVAGALLIGLNEIAIAMRGGGDQFATGLGCVVLVVAGIVLVVAFVQWIRTG